MRGSLLDVSKKKAKKAVLNALERLSGDRHLRNQTLLSRFVRCQDFTANRDLLRASRRRRTARPRRNAACPTARMAAAADLMASGSHLVIPYLDGIPTEQRFHAGGRASIRLAQTLLEVDIADPTDWRRVRRDPTAYVEATLNRWIDLHGGKTIRRRFNLRATLSDLVDEYAEAAEQDPDGRHLYFVVHPDSAAYVVAGATLELPEREHGRLPATFYHVFTGALNKCLRIYDHRDAEDRVEMLREWAEGDEEQYEIADVAGSVPDCMKRQPLSLESLRRLGVQAGSREAKAVIAATLELHGVSEKVNRPAFADEIGERL